MLVEYVWFKDLLIVSTATPLALTSSWTQIKSLSCPRRLADWCHGERMRDGERGWFPANCAKEITNLTAMEQNVQRMKRLRKETNV